MIKDKDKKIEPSKIPDEPDPLLQSESTKGKGKKQLEKESDIQTDGDIKIVKENKKKN